MASARRCQSRTMAISKFGACLKAPSKKLKLFGGTMVSSIGKTRVSPPRLVVTLLVWVAATFLGALPLHAQEVTLNCGPGGKLISVVANGNRTVMPPESNLTDRLAFLRRDIEQKRKKYLSEICAEAEACLGQVGSGDRKKWGFRESIMDISLILAQAVASDVDPKVGMTSDRMWEEQRRLEKLAEADPAAYRVLAKEGLEKLKISARNSNPAIAAAAFEGIEKMLSICRTSGVAGDFDSNKKAIPPAIIKLEYPNRGINRNKIGRYDKNALEKVVEHALIADIDPYAALAIVMLEDAPIASSSTGYLQRYGRIPVDAIGAYDTLGCFSSATKRKPIHIKSEELATFRSFKSNSDKATELYRAADRALRKKISTNEQRQSRFNELYDDAQSAILNESNRRNYAMETERRAEEYRVLLTEMEQEFAALTKQLSEAQEARRSSIDKVSENPQLAPTATPEPVVIMEIGKPAYTIDSDGKEMPIKTNPFAELFNLESRSVNLQERLVRTRNQLRFAEEDSARERARREAQSAALQTAMSDPELAKALQLFRASELARNEYFRFRDSLDYEKILELECLVNRSHCQGRLQTQNSVPTFDLRSIASESLAPESTRKFCTTSKYVKTGASPELWEGPRMETTPPDPSDSCCVEVKSNLSRDDSRVALLSHLGAEFFRKNIQSCFGTQPMELCLQKFNGMGCFGCTERMPNNCYDGIVGSDRPIYGARAADLMLNTLMPNPDISELIGDVARKIGRTGISGFCRGKAEGKVTVASNAFFEMQKRFLLEGEKTQHLARFGNGLRKPASASEQDTYKKREAERAKQCSIHFR